jgi:YesN/AraC family two-component response regulator
MEKGQLTGYLVPEINLRSSSEEALCMKFLIAEDNSRMRESIKRFIVGNIANHHTFHEAADGREAVELYGRISPDWVLMDIKMPTMDGLTASKAILASDPEARIIILTSYDDIAYRKAAADAGTYAYVLKEHLNEIPEIVSS